MKYIIVNLLLVLNLISCSSSSRKRVISEITDCYQQLLIIIDAPKPSKKTFEKKTLLKMSENSKADLEDLRKAYGRESLFDIKYTKGLNKGEIEKNNQMISNLLDKEPFAKKVKKGEISAASSEELKSIYLDLLSTPCVREDYQFQRPDVSVGYCFGRAIMSHFISTFRGVTQRAQKKIWVVGKMDGGWGHHVAHIVQGEDGQWWAMDNVTGLVSHKEWMHKIKLNNETEDDPLMFFVTEASRFGPAENSQYSPSNFFNLPFSEIKNNEDKIIQEFDISKYEKEKDYYIGFFYAVLEYLDKNKSNFEKFSKLRKKQLEESEHAQKKKKKKKKNDK